MVEITLKNGSKFQIQTLVFHGKIIDSNGTESGGNATYNAVFMPATTAEGTEESAES